MFRRLQSLFVKFKEYFGYKTKPISPISIPNSKLKPNSAILLSKSILKTPKNRKRATANNTPDTQIVSSDEVLAGSIIGATNWENNTSSHESLDVNDNFGGGSSGGGGSDGSWESSNYDSGDSGSSSSSNSD